MQSENARIAQLVEHDLAKVGVAGSSPVSRSFFMRSTTLDARVAELVDALDLKSNDQQRSCRFDSGSGYKSSLFFNEAAFVFLNI